MCLPTLHTYYLNGAILIAERYPLLEFDIVNFFMVGSPTGIFLTARGAGYPLRLPKCTNIYNIYNPNDPVVRYYCDDNF